MPRGFPNPNIRSVSLTIWRGRVKWSTTMANPLLSPHHPHPHPQSQNPNPRFKRHHIHNNGVEASDGSDPNLRSGHLRRMGLHPFLQTRTNQYHWPRTRPWPPWRPQGYVGRQFALVGLRFSFLQLQLQRLLLVQILSGIFFVLHNLYFKNVFSCTLNWL